MPFRVTTFIRCFVRMSRQSGLDPVTGDVELRRGVWIEGKISDKVTVSHAGDLKYFARAATRT